MFKRIALAALSATMGPVVIIAMMGLRLEAQIAPPAADTPTFEAASVRPAADTGRRGGRGTPGRFQGFNLPARQLIRQAYDIHDAQIVGGPDWLASDGFDINATTGDKPPDLIRFMMQTLLRDRFKLAFHTEKRELPIYALVVARSDGKIGSGLKRIPDGECPPPGARRGAPPAGGPPAAPPPPFDPNAAGSVRRDHLRAGPAAGARCRARSTCAIDRRPARNHRVQSNRRERNEARGSVRFRLQVDERIRSPRRPTAGRAASGTGAGRRTDDGHRASGTTRPEARRAPRNCGRHGH